MSLCLSTTGLGAPELVSERYAAAGAVLVTSIPWRLPELSKSSPTAVQLPGNAHDTPDENRNGFGLVAAPAGRGARAAAQLPEVWVSSTPWRLPELSA